MPRKQESSLLMQESSRLKQEHWYKEQKLSNFENEWFYLISKTSYLTDNLLNSLIENILNCRNLFIFVTK